MSREKKLRSMFRENNHCHYCGRPTWHLKLSTTQGPYLEQATLDHIVLYSMIKNLGKEAAGVTGKYTRTNMVIACRRCNWSRQTLEYETFKAMVKPDAEMTEDDWDAITELKKQHKRIRGQWFAYWGRLKKYGVDLPA